MASDERRLQQEICREVGEQAPCCTGVEEQTWDVATVEELYDKAWK